MADFWIKIEKNTPDKPEVLEMADILGIDDPDTIMGKLIRVWSWFDSNSENGHAPSVTRLLIDRITSVTGFTNALIKVGWLTQNDQGYQMVNFDRHIGKGAKKRALSAERQRISRECHANVTEKSQKSNATNVTKARPEKSRVDKSKDIKDICIKKSESWKTFFKLYPPNKKGGSDQTAWKKAKSLNLTDDDFELMINNLKKRKELCPDWYRQFAQGITKYIGEQIWLTEIVPEMSNEKARHTKPIKQTPQQRTAAQAKAVRARIDAYQGDDDVLGVDDVTVQPPIFIQ